MYKISELIKGELCFFPELGYGFYRDMTIGITFEFSLAPFEESILTNYDVVPVPSGVQLNIRQVVPPYFGFATDAYPFNDGTFYRD